MDVIRLVVTVSLIVLAVLGVRLWLRHRSPPSAWLTLMFLSLGAARLALDVLPEEPTGAAAAAAATAVGVLVAFPYLLFRFAESFEPVDHRWRRFATGLAAATALATGVATWQVPAVGPEPAWYSTFVLAVIGYWTLLTAWVVWRFWAAGRGQPTVARRRMWTLALAAGLLNAALLLAGVGGTDTMAAAAQVVAIVSAVTFVLAFTPPRFVRALWRRADERALWHAYGGLVSASTRDEVVSGVLPHVSRLLGGEGALLIDERSGEETVVGLSPERRDEIRRRVRSETGAAPTTAAREGVAAMRLREGVLGVATSVYTPLFGRDELELMERLGALVDLAMSRAELYDRERVARAAADGARARAEAVSRELEALVYGISHDLRTPIVSVRGYVDLLSEDYADRLDDQGRHFLSRLQSNTSYMDQLIGDLLKLSRTGRVPDEPESVALTEVAKQVTEEFRADYPEAMIEVGTLPTVALGPTRARQVLTNLVANALAHAGRRDVRVRVAGWQEGNTRGLSVADNGQGIPAAYRERVFEIFETLGSQAKGEQSGTGIGLAIVRRIVEDAGGRIWVAETERGTDVRVELPPAPVT